MKRALGRKVPPDWEHVKKYPLSAVEIKKPTPVTIGANWYTSFDEPKEIARETFRLPDVSKGEELGSIRGGHCFSLRPPTIPDRTYWWGFYNQREEGACEGFGHSRSLSLISRKTYDAFWLYDDARRKEGTYPEGEGSTNRAACSALVSWGDHIEGGLECYRQAWKRNAPGTRIRSYHWATKAQEVLSALGAGDSAVLLNSWGKEYPHEVILPGSTLERLLQEEGECDIYVV